MTNSKSSPSLDSARSVARALRGVADSERAKNYRWFFKTGKGQYGEGDVFIGVTVPQVRRIARGALHVPLCELDRLLQSKVHEDRLCALIILTHRYESANELERRAIFDFYLAHTDRINNWDLVDVSCHKIVGRHLEAKNRALLHRLARSPSLWERRIAIVSTAWFIGKSDLTDTFAIARILLYDPHDLIHKAVGWMLREAGKKDIEALRAFLTKHATTMPRTMLRYAIERMSAAERERWRVVKKV